MAGAVGMQSPGLGPTSVPAPAPTVGATPTVAGGGQGPTPIRNPVSGPGTVGGVFLGSGSATPTGGPAHPAAVAGRTPGPQFRPDLRGGQREQF